MQARLQVFIESRAIWCAILGGLMGLVVGLVVFWGERVVLAESEYSGDSPAVQFYASIVGGVAAGVAFLIGWSLNTRMANLWLGQRWRLRQLIDTLALVVVHSSIAVMAALGIFRLFQDAFIGLTVDDLAGAVFCGLVGAVAAYFSFNSGARINAFTLSTILASFMASGVLVSMLFAENPFWWHVMFSELGTGQAGSTSFWTFNTTLVVSGIIITTLTAFITRDLEIWAEHTRDKLTERIQRRQQEAAAASSRGKVPLRLRATAPFARHLWTPRVMVVRIGMIVMGLSLAGVGLIPISLHHDAHVVATASFGLSFLFLLVGIPYWLPGFPRTFYLVSYLSAAGLVFAFTLWRPVGYYNLTSLELIGAAILFSWLIIFVRNIAAQVERVRQVVPQSQLGGTDSEAAG